MCHVRRTEPRLGGLYKGIWQAHSRWKAHASVVILQLCFSVFNPNKNFSCFDHDFLLNIYIFCDWILKLRWQFEQLNNARVHFSFFFGGGACFDCLLTPSDTLCEYQCTADCRMISHEHWSRVTWWQKERFPSLLDLFHTSILEREKKKFGNGRLITQSCVLIGQTLCLSHSSGFLLVQGSTWDVHHGPTVTPL